MTATAEQPKTVEHYSKVWVYIRHIMLHGWEVVEANELQVVTQGKSTTIFWKIPKGRKWRGNNFQMDTTCWVVDKRMILPPTQVEITTDRDSELGCRVFTPKYDLFKLEPWEAELMQAIESHGAKLLHRLEPNDFLGGLKPV